jgi:two-component system cell cycle response regulator DivK
MIKFLRNRQANDRDSLMQTHMNGTILYVEDNRENRILVKRILMVEGFEVLEAGSAKSALELLETVTPDLILMDMNMPIVDGYALTSQLRSMEKLRFVPIIAITANVMVGDRERTLEAGCDGYIQKPVDVDTFGHEVTRFLRR